MDPSAGDDPAQEGVCFVCGFKSGLVLACDVKGCDKVRGAVPQAAASSALCHVCACHRRRRRGKWRVSVTAASAATTGVSVLCCCLLLHAQHPACAAPSQVFHVQCLGCTMPPEADKWYCPRHSCAVCGLQDRMISRSETVTRPPPPRSPLASPPASLRGAM